MGQKLSDLMLDVALDISELSNIKGGALNPEEAERACDTGACSSNIDTVVPYCSTAVCRTAA